MNVTFRTDASLQIGTGHVMRCLTLADELAARGAECEFICREHEGNLIAFVRQKGYVVHSLPVLQKCDFGLEQLLADHSTSGTSHIHWLGATQVQDAEACVQILARRFVDLLIVDHYALDDIWEEALAKRYQKLMVIDDLADRPHISDVLLDQTYGRDETDYTHLVPPGCRLLCGSQYALLRPEFAALRTYSLERRADPVLRELLVSMGGVDKDNVTAQVLQSLRSCPLPENCRITVVMGATAPWLTEVQAFARDMPWHTRVMVGVSDMAQLMADSDLAIGAAGATSWERCCLGLPTVMFVLAENQRKIAGGLSESGAANLYDSSNLASDPFVIREKYFDPSSLRVMSQLAASVTDGFGANRVTTLLINKFEHANQLPL